MLLIEINYAHGTVPHVMHKFCMFFIIILFQFLNEVQYRDILHRQYVRWSRRVEKEARDEMWGDTPEAREYGRRYPFVYDDIFSLRKLFGLEPYEEEEIW